MKNLTVKLSTLLALVLLVTSSCTKNETFIYNIENVTVRFNSNELLETKVKPLGKLASTNPSTSEYEHVFPSSYKAYFVSKQTKGQYTEGQVVKVIDVVAGGNTITIPKLDYDVYVTNYTHSAEKWYTWNNAIEQLPQSSHVLYLYGKNRIDYSTVTEGQVELTNPYSAVMIEKNQWVSGIPTFYGDGKDYASVTGWYLNYIRTGNTNTKVPISIAGNPNQNYTLTRTIKANEIYQFTIDGGVLDQNGNLGIVVQPLIKVTKETINL